MRRRDLAFLYGGAAILWPLAAGTRQIAMRMIGFLALGSFDQGNRFDAGFRQGLRETGYVDGENVRIEYRRAEGKAERLPALAAELVALNVDVIVAAGGTLSALAAKRATTSIPIVFTGVGDPVGEGLVTSLARPGGNITGLSAVAPELIGKWLELLKEAVPGVSLIALLLKPDAEPRAKETRLMEAEAAARALGVRLQVFEAKGPEDFDRTFSDMSEAHVGALAIQTTPMFNLEHKRLVDLATKHRLPTVFTWPYYADAGGLMSYGPDLANLDRRTATYVGKILNGTPPADLPVEQPTKFKLVINMKTAKELGLTIPQLLLQRADEVIE
jgi:putative tryptophan/tyrosine transport system substrate-binding protein